VVEDTAQRFLPPDSYPEQWDLLGLAEESRRLLNIEPPLTDWAAKEGVDANAVVEQLTLAATQQLTEHLDHFPPEFRQLATQKILLDELDKGWKDHLSQLDHLREGIGLRAYGQRDPLNEFKQEAFKLFEAMLAEVRENVVAVITRLEIRVENLTNDSLMFLGPQSLGMPPELDIPPAAAPFPSIASFGQPSGPMVMSLNRASRRRVEKLQKTSESGNTPRQS
jgi:preprotein translocase subunit SecA